MRAKTPLLRLDDGGIVSQPTSKVRRAKSGQGVEVFGCLSESWHNCMGNVHEISGIVRFGCLLVASHLSRERGERFTDRTTLDLANFTLGRDHRSFSHRRETFRTSKIIEKLSKSCRGNREKQLFMNGQGHPGAVQCTAFSAARCASLDLAYLENKHGVSFSQQGKNAIEEEAKGSSLL